MSHLETGIFENPPENFDHRVQVSACLLEVKGRLLSLQRGEHKHNPRTWEVPGGKFGDNESLNDCAKRELSEETGIDHTSFREIGVLYVRRVEGDFTLRVVHAELTDYPQVSLSKEHQSYEWVTPDEMRELDLIPGEELLIDMFEKSTAQTRTV